MSAAGRSKTPRIVNDFYPTPSWAVRRLLKAVTLPTDRWLEPSAGYGAIIKAVNSVIPPRKWTAVELQRHAYLKLYNIPGVDVHISDFTLYASAYYDGISRGILRPFDITIGNPPYSLAMEFIQYSLAISNQVAFLLRLNFLGSDKRADWLRSHPADIYVLPNRISGTADGRTDSTEYAWFIWTRGDNRQFGKYTILDSTSIKERQVDYK